MSDNHSLIPAFNFRVLFKGLEGIQEIDSRFQSVSGIRLSRNTNANEYVQTGQGNTFFHPIVLRRALVSPKNSMLLQWALNSLNSQEIKLLPEVLIEVLNDEGNPDVIIILRNVSARSWSISDLHAEKSELLMEELVLDYHSVDIVSGS